MSMVLTGNTLAHLMMLAFLGYQAQLIGCKVVRMALEPPRRLSEMYRKVRTYFDTFVFKNWGELYSAIAYGIETSFQINFPRGNTS